MIYINDPTEYPHPEVSFLFIGSEEADVSINQNDHEIELEFEKNPFRVEYKSMGNHSPFFDINPLGDSKLVLVINKDHNFFSHVLSEASNDVRSNLELLLFSIGKAKSTARGQAKILYHTELTEWSRYLQSAIEVKSKYKEHKSEDELAVFLEANESKL